jgi:hypothetical protein
MCTGTVPDATSDAAASDAGSPISWDGRAPLDHRASPTACPEEREAGAPCAAGTGPFPTEGSCEQDSDCTMGKNGRCLAFPNAPPEEAGRQCGAICSYDDCFVDSDCPPRVPCVCRDVTIYGDPNVCSTQSQCAVDSQCGPPGFCSPQAGSPFYGYFCHTLRDLCIDNTDCPSGDSCEFDTMTNRWFCFMPPMMR